MPLIVFEGIDASGKKTQAQLLVRKLKKLGKKAVLLEFPTYSSVFGKLIIRYLKGGFGPREKISKRFASLLYALDRYSRAEEIAGYLKTGFTVVLDRYTQANLAYQTAGLPEKSRLELLKWIETVESALPRADEVVFLDVPPLQSERLLSGRRNKIRGVRRDMHEKDLAFMRKVYANYRRLAKAKKWLVVKCLEKNRLKSPGEISDLVYRALAQRKVL